MKAPTHKDGSASAAGLPSCARADATERCPACLKTLLQEALDEAGDRLVTGAKRYALPRWLQEALDEAGDRLAALEACDVSVPACLPVHLEEADELAASIQLPAWYPSDADLSARLDELARQVAAAKAALAARKGEAAIRPLNPSHRVVITCAGKRVEFDAPRGLVRICNEVDECLLVSAEEVQP